MENLPSIKKNWEIVEYDFLEFSSEHPKGKPMIAQCVKRESLEEDLKQTDDNGHLASKGIQFESFKYSPDYRKKESKRLSWEQFNYLGRPYDLEETITNAVFSSFDR